jgi:hypothetical protein
LRTRQRTKIEAATQNDEVRGYAYDAFLQREKLKGASSSGWSGHEIKALFANPASKLSLNFTNIQAAYKE